MARGSPSGRGSVKGSPRASSCSGPPSGDTFALANGMAVMFLLTAVWSWGTLLWALAGAPGAAPGAGLAQARCLASAFEKDLLAGGAAPMRPPPSVVGDSLKGSEAGAEEARDGTRRCSLPPVFTVGATRGGAGLIFDAISSAASVVPVLGESNVFATDAPPVPATGACPCLAADQGVPGIPLDGTPPCGGPDDVMDCWARACAAAGGARWVEHSQKHVSHVPRILRSVRGGAVVVVVVRDGRDVSTALARRAVQGLEKGGGSGPAGEVTALDMAAARTGACFRWVSETRSALRAVSRAEAPNVGYCVRFEDAVLYPDATAKHLAKVIDGDRAETRAMAAALSDGGGREGGHDGVEVGMWEGSMDEDLAAACRGTDDFVRLLHLMGYDKDGSWGAVPTPENDLAGDVDDDDEYDGDEYDVDEDERNDDDDERNDDDDERKDGSDEDGGGEGKEGDESK